MQSAHSFLRLWTHENRRVFKDRLTNDTDRVWIDTLLSDTLVKYFSVTWNEIEPNGPLLFGDYLDGMGAEQRVYDEVKDIGKAVQLMEEARNEYNEENSPMKLTLFTDCVEHISRISRVLRQPGGNALLLGVGGSGRQSLTKLACYMSEYELFQIEVSKQYGLNEWREDLKKLLLSAGLKEQPTVFLVTDTQLTNELFYNDLNNILNSGDVPNLYSD